MAGIITSVTPEWQLSVIDPIEALIERWQGRGESDAVGMLLPAWRANAGLTDGWQHVLAAMQTVRASVTLPTDEAATLTRAASRIELALRER